MSVSNNSCLAAASLHMGIVSTALIDQHQQLSLDYAWYDCWADGAPVYCLSLTLSTPFICSVCCSASLLVTSQHALSANSVAAYQVDDAPHVAADVHSEAFQLYRKARADQPILTRWITAGEEFSSRAEIEMDEELCAALKLALAAGRNHLRQLVMIPKR